MIRCEFCPRCVQDVEAAVNAGWIPPIEVWSGDRAGAATNPVCPSCARQYLALNEHDEYDLVERPQGTGHYPACNCSGDGSCGACWPAAD